MSEQTLALARELVAKKLSDIHGSWSIANDYVQGPGSTRILVQDHSEQGQAAHLDFGFYFNVGHPDPLILWDCAAGLGDSEDFRVRMSVDVWTTCTAVVFLEFLAREGKLAEHAMGEDGLGLKGWHAILGPVWAFGAAQNPGQIQEWVLEHPLLPQMGDSLSGAFRRDRPNGAKLFFGSSGDEDVAEVRINGVEHKPASEALLRLKWPRFKEATFARCYIMFVHPI